MAKKNGRNPRNTVCYTLIGDFGNPVYHGITSDINRRLREHTRDGKNFSRVTVSPKRTRARAEQDETSAIHSHQDSNLFGNPPYYNVAKTRKTYFRWGWL
ncbi:MAG: hypothetical protein NTV68_05690 [Methanomicrobiales archaeon]|nr:hypothetical protein [Methanomicrobiales archaeon]